MRISFITDFSSQTINLDLYRSEQNPFILGVGGSDAAIRSAVNTEINNRYGSLISTTVDTTDTTTTNFDFNILFPLKKAQSTFKGGVFFDLSATSGGDTFHQFTTVVNTKGPTSFYFLQTLAAQSYINSQFSKSITIDVLNYPLPRTYNQLQLNNTISGFFGSFIFSLALAFKFASIISFIVKEREDRSKHQQIVSGMKLSSYWLANYLYDYILYLILAVAALILISALDVSSLTGDSLGATWALFILYGLAYIPFTYIAAFVFKDYGNAQAGFYFFTFLIGGLLSILCFVLRIISVSANSVGRGLAWFFRIFPCFSFGEGVLNLGTKAIYAVV